MTLTETRWCHVGRDPPRLVAFERVINLPARLLELALLLRFLI
jgi:hypothetical protein